MIAVDLRPDPGRHDGSPDQIRRWRASGDGLHDV